MRAVAFTEFRRNASKLLDRVEKGETIQIQRHGRAVALLSPPAARQKVPAWKQPHTPLVGSGRTLAALILEDRESAG